MGISNRSPITDHRSQWAFVRATKNPPRPRNKLTYAPDAVSREYRGKIMARKDYFALRLSFRAKSRNLWFGCRKVCKFSRKTVYQKHDAAV
jgi:hypothetical protein